MISYIKGDATAPAGENPRIIVHVCNDIGGWGKGFVVAISKRWSAPEAQYRAWYRDKRTGEEVPFELGQVQIVEVEHNLWVANIIGQQGLRWSKGKPPIRYDAIRDGLERVGSFAAEIGASIHMPRIGCGLAGGKWEEILPLIEKTLDARELEVTVYDFG